LNGFLFHQGRYTTIDEPNAPNGTAAIGINAQGDVVGSSNDGTGLHDLLLHQGTYTTLDHPDAVLTLPLASMT
jgi:hypothetical protein